MVKKHFKVAIVRGNGKIHISIFEKNKFPLSRLSIQLSKNPSNPIFNQGGMLGFHF